MYSILVWDWNGTLLNDVEHNIAIVNELLGSRGYDRLSRERYRTIFRMPISDFYRDAGFDLDRENFADIAREYNRLYVERFHRMPLTEGIVDVLEHARANNIAQYIVSASEQKSLVSQVSEKGIARYFTEVVGNDDYSVVSKTEKARLLRMRLPEDARILFVGDLLHDAEVAAVMGADCVMYRHGHQEPRSGETRLSWRLIDSMKDIVGLLRT